MFTIRRLQGTTSRAVCTVRPHVVLRSRQRRPDAARNAMRATPGGWSVARCAGIAHLAPLALDWLFGAFGLQSLVAVLTRGRLPLHTYVLADEYPSRCLAAQVSRPTIV